MTSSLCADPGVVERLSPRQLVGRLQRAAAELDAAAVARRRRRAEADRHVSLRPAPDVMTWLGALLPVKAGVAVHATLHREALSAKAAGDPRSIGQLMADILVQRVVHPGLADSAIARPDAEITWTSASTPASASTVLNTPSANAVPVVVNLIVRDSVLFGDEDGTGWVEGHGPVPGDLIRQWIADNREADVEVRLRRLYEQPATGNLVAMDSRSELFGGLLAEFIRIRDRVCRTVGCGALVRHTDHVEPRSRGRTHHGRQRPRALRVLQLRQRGRRLDRPHHPRPSTHRRDHHSHRTHLHLDSRPPLSHPHAAVGPRSC